ncbi:hypothetical protein FDZ71_00505 [bacterium]|nr:MAG: hypothetical protein FDZ71_00505 [bacterium]
MKRQTLDRAERTDGERLQAPIARPRTTPRRSRTRLGCLLFTLLLALAVGATILIAWRDTYRPALRTVHVGVPGLSRTYRILQVSDLHGSEFGEGQSRLDALVGDHRYDAVVFTGDMVAVRFADPEPAVETARVLSDAGPTFFVAGNHDDPGVAPLLERAGVTDLDAARSERLTDSSGALVLCTVGGAASARRVAGDVVVVLAHVPLSEGQLVALAGSPARAALVLSGHTHAGTVRLPPIGAVFAPPVGDVSGWTRFPDLKGLHISGLRQRAGTQVFISPGLGPGTYGLVPSWWHYRLGARAEIDEIVLEPAP